jgi:transposase
VTVSLELQAEILRLAKVEGWTIGAISSHLGVHHGTISRHLAKHHVAPVVRARRSSIFDPFLPFVQKTLERYPELRASRLWHLAKEQGYPGGIDHFREQIARLRPRTTEAFLRRTTLPADEAQVDWGHFGKLVVGRAHRTLWAFVMVLSHSRQIFLRFSLSAAMPSFLRGHVEAFAFFGGVPRVLLYDNLKSAVLERVGDTIRFHPTLLELSKHYLFRPQPVAVARGNEKGRVERAIQYIRHAFFAARPFVNVVDLNAQAHAWCLGEAAERPWREDRRRTIAEAFAEEKPKLLALHEHPFEADDTQDVSVGKTPYVRFDLNDYSIPPNYVRRTLTVRASEARVRILDGTTVVADHARSWDREQVIEEARHLEELRERKRHAREGSAMASLGHKVPSSKLLLEALAQRGGNLGATVVGLTRLLERHGADELEAAVAQALSRGLPSLPSVRLALDQARQARGQPPEVTLSWPDQPRLDGLSVVPTKLGAYDGLSRSKEPR